MPWVWSDELANRLVESGIIEPDRVRDSLPVAFAVDDPTDLVRLGRTLLGIELSEAPAS